jgi:hypothetical protein
MKPIFTSLCWATGLILLAVANRAGLIADSNATTLFTVIPALWVVSGGVGRCRSGKASA